MLLFSFKSHSITVALFDHQVDEKLQKEHKIINFEPSIAATNNHASNLLCGLKNKINLYLYPFLEFKDNRIYFSYLKDAISKNVDYIWIPSSSSVFSIKELEYLRIAQTKGIKVITSSGNESLNLDKDPRYPCSYNLSNIICIQTKETFSNKIAKGFLIQDSSLKDCSGKYQRGTSQATVIYLNQFLN